MKEFSLVIICFFVFLQLNGQVITNYTTSEGLLDNFVECLDVDSDDNIWFGTSIGAQMFDGTNWTTYNTSNYPGMASDNIKVITSMSNVPYSLWSTVCTQSIFMLIFFKPNVSSDSADI